jgi:predicted component of viral defense system (DUF524 family)
MKVPFYSKNLRMAIAEDPLLLAKEDNINSFASTQEDVLELEELETYFLKFYDDYIPDFFSPIASRYNDSCIVREKYPNNLFEINFSNSVGMTRIGPVKVRVQSVKITESLYHSMLDYVAEKYANLVFSFDAPLGENYSKSKPGTDIAYIEYLFLKKYLLDNSPNLDGIAALILSNPHIRLYSEHRLNPIENTSSLHPGILFKTLMKANGFLVLPTGHPLLGTGLGKALSRQTGKNLFPSQVFEERRYHTSDTNENRFVKHFLKRIQHRMDGLSSSLKGLSGGFLNPDIETNIKEITRKVVMFLNDPFWQDVGTMSFIPTNSQVLQRREGYRQLFSLYSLLQLCTRCDFDIEDFKNLLETKDTPTLFEYWSFFLIKEILDGIGKIVSCKAIVSENHREQRVFQGISIQYEDGATLWFNKYCSGSSGYQPGDVLLLPENVKESYSHNLIPDIVVSKDENMLIFDAKYKGKGRNGSFYDEDDQGGISSWKDADIDKMHTYREAIQNVVGAFILYPGEKSVIYPSHDAKRLFEGVGALPLKPMTGSAPVREHIEDIRQIIHEFVKAG